MVAYHGAQSLEPVSPQQEPELKCTEAPTERNRPFAIVDEAFATMGLEKFGLYGQRADQRIGIAHEMGRAVELGAEPFVRIEHQAVDRLDPTPQGSEFRADHGRPGPGGVDVNIKAVSPGD